MKLGSDGEESVPAAHSTVVTAPIHIRREIRFRRPAPTRSGATGVEIAVIGGAGAVGHRDAAREVWHGTVDVFRGQRIRRRARVHLVVRLEAARKRGAVLDIPRAIRARLHRARKHSIVPPVEEVGMQPVAGRVPVRQHELAASVQLVVWAHAIPHLIEEGYEVDWMRGWALAAVDATRVRHMGLVICRVEVHAIPAAREEHLCPEAIRAIRVCESWRLLLSRAIEIDAKSIVFVSC